MHLKHVSFALIAALAVDVAAAPTQNIANGTAALEPHAPIRLSIRKFSLPKLGSPKTAPKAAPKPPAKANPPPPSKAAPAPTKQQLSAPPVAASKAPSAAPAVPPKASSQGATAADKPPTTSKSAESSKSLASKSTSAESSTSLASKSTLAASSTSLASKSTSAASSSSLASKSTDAAACAFTPKGKGKNLKRTNCATAARATATFDCSRQPHICVDNCWHRNCLKGSPAGSSGALTRVGKATNKLNRASSGFNKAKSSKLCSKAPFSQDPAAFTSLEEFPFASTQEGGSGSSVRCVPVAEQRVQFAKIGGVTSHLADGDKFDVEFSNVAAMYAANPGLPDYCKPVIGGLSTCKNDGFQLIFDGNTLVNDTRGKGD